MENISYEDVFEQELLRGLKAKFHIEDTRRLLMYLITRYHILNGKVKKLEADEFMRFMLREIAVSEDENNSGVLFKYNGLAKFIAFGYNEINSLNNVYDSIMCNLYIKTVNDPNGTPMKVDEYIISVYNSVIKTAKLNIKPYKNSTYRKELLLLLKLRALNNHFGILSPNTVPVINFFYQDDSLMSAIDTLYERYLHAENFDTTNVKSLTESQIRDYLYNNIELIEPGLKPIAKEYPTSEGRADIVAKDVDDNLVVIEIKIENDKRLIWQCMYYPDEIKKRIEADKYVRMITIIPEYPDYLMGPLSKLGYVETFQYSIRASNGNIESMCIERVGELTAEKLRKNTIEDRLGIDRIVDAFVYTKDRLSASLDDEMDLENICDIAKDLVKIHYFRDEQPSEI